MSKKYKVGIIGAGAIVESGHIPVLKVLPNVSVEWVYDRDPGRSELLSKMFQVPVWKDADISDAIDQIDICLITIPYGARREYIKLCASKKKALYVEKPFAISVEEHREYCELFDHHMLAVGFQRRYYRIVSLLQNIVSSGIFGKLTNIYFNQGYFALKGNKEFLSNASLSGGGVIIESAIHTLDQLLLITEAETVSVTELSSLQKKGIDYDSIFETALKVKENSIAVKIEVSTLRNLDNGVRFVFENAVVSCGMSPDEKLKLYDHNNKPMKFDMGLLNVAANDINNAKSISAAFYYFWAEFLQAIETGNANRTSAINSLLTTEWMEQVYKKINHNS